MSEAWETLTLGDGAKKKYCYDLCQSVFCLCLLPWVLYLQVLHVNPQYLWAILCLNHFQHKLTPASILNCHECGSFLSSWVVSWLFISLLGMIVIIVVYICLTVPSEKAMAPHSSTLAWKIPWTEKPGRLQPMGSWRVGHDWVTSLSLFTFMHWRRKWQPTPVFLPGES